MVKAHKIRNRPQKNLEELLLEYADHACISPETVSVTSCNSEDDTALHLFSLRGNKQAVLTLLEAGSKVNAKGDMGNTPLHYAVMTNSLSVAEILLKFGADKNIRSDFNSTPLEDALQYGNKEMIKLLRAN